MSGTCSEISRRLRLGALFAILLGMLLFPGAAHAGSGTVWYVNAGARPGGSGHSWAGAFTGLQDALARAHAGDQIWVAAGIYKPTADGDRSATFLLVSGVAVYGGFPAGGSPGMPARERRKHATILSGEIGAPGVADNSYHVVTGVTGATLDGFTVTSGNADGSAPQDSGGGLYNTGASPAVSNCVFSGNTAKFGAGLDNLHGSSPTISGCVFSGNTATIVGGGLGDYDQSSPTIVDCVFWNNTAPTGAAIDDYKDCSPVLVACTFSGNTADEGAAIYDYDGCFPTLTDCILWGDTGDAEFHEDGGSMATVTYSLVQGGFAGTGNLSADPRFVNAATGNLHLLAGSPAIDTGTSTGAPAVDLDGVRRPQGAGFDMGAYEKRGTPGRDR